MLHAALLIAGLAHAEDPSPPADDDSGWTDLSPTDEVLGSALAPLETRAPEPVELPPEVEALRRQVAAATAAARAADAPRPTARTRGRFGGRPRLAAAGITDDAWGLLVGASLTHQWWRLSDRVVRPAGATRLDVGGRVGDARGADLRLASVHGVWFGPVGLLAGPVARWDRLTGEAAALPAGRPVGPQVRAALRLPGLLPWAAASRGWVLAGARAAGPEDTLDFGLDLGRSGLTWRLSGAVRDTTIGTLWEAGLGFHLQL